MKSCLAALKTGGIRAFAHITGGGLTENLPRVLPDGLTAALDTASWPMPPVFDWLAREGGISAGEMRRTFNCGIGMVVIVESQSAPAVRSALEEAGEAVYAIGRIVPRDGGAAVTYSPDSAA